MSIHDELRLQELQRVAKRRFDEALEIWQKVHSRMNDIREERTDRSSKLVHIIEALFVPDLFLSLPESSPLYLNEAPREKMYEHMGLEFATKKNHIEGHMGFEYNGPHHDQFKAEYFRYDVRRAEWVLNVLETLSDERIEELFLIAQDLEKSITKS